MAVEDDVGKIKSAIAQRKVRLANGVARRQKMADELEQGIVTKTARYQWLIKTASEINALLARASRKFNDENPDDLISTFDLSDALTTAKGNIMRASEKPEEQFHDVQ